ncbi:hypothetical protein QLS91_07985 [Flavobacterium sp. LB2P84]|uniref:hypothetical protein n=1 Tax=Flavobacterium yafengii TaxID=3041253 RepID=UPI0024A975E7|nr:hypothetical protein [Flavobacterium yafengii]MDI6033011.1 hypothetical protein [Flavobacterium yafengii]
MIKASNNPFPCKPNDQYPDKLDKGGYTGTAQNLKDDIDALALPNQITKLGLVTLTGLTLSIEALEFEGRIDTAFCTNETRFESTINLAPAGFKRIDIFVLTAYNAIVKISGEETEDVLIKRLAPKGTLEVAYIVVNDTTIDEPVLPEEGSPSIIERAPFSTFKFVQKGVGNVNLKIDEIRDIFSGFKNDSTERWSEAEWLGGSKDNSDNFKPLVRTIL